MSNLLRTYALIRALYYQGEDYIDSFWPFAIQVLDISKYSDTSTIQNKILERCGINIPLHVLGIILKRARKNKYLEYQIEPSPGIKRELYKLTTQGSQFLDKLETQDEVERRINELLIDIAVFFSERNIALSRDQLLEMLLRVFQDNVRPLKEFLDPTTVNDGENGTILDTNTTLLIGYLKIAERQKPDKYQTVQDILFGSIVSTIISTGTTYDINALVTAKHRNCRIFLDTNFILSILDLRPSSEIVEAAKELFQLMKNYKYILRVFDFTVSEIVRVLSYYLTEEHKYTQEVIVDDVCSCLKRKGWTKAQLIEYITSIEKTLSKLGIETEFGYAIDLKTYQPKNTELRSRIAIYKPNQNILGQNHDLAAIETIRKIRGHSSRSLDLTPALFLTSDAALSKFDFQEMGHREYRTVTEVILDRLFTNILWLKMPNSKPTLKSIISSHSRNLFIKTRIWNRFYDVLHEIKVSGQADDESISMLFYHGYIEESLKHFEEYEVDEITRDFILEEIVKASKLHEEEVERRVKAKESEFFKQLTLISHEKESQKEKEWLQKFDDVKENIKKSSEIISNRWVLVIRFLVILVLAIPLIIFFTKSQDVWAEISRVANIIQILIFIFGLFIGSVPQIWNYIRNLIFKRIYFRRISESGLDKILPK